jgi:hypothetical protein
MCRAGYTRAGYEIGFAKRMAQHICIISVSQAHSLATATVTNRELAGAAAAATAMAEHCTRLEVNSKYVQW